MTHHPRPAADQPTRLVLYVEDRPANIRLMRAIFSRRWAYLLCVATDGEAAMQIARQLRPDLLLLDIHLPDCVGSDLLERMRQLPGWEAVPAVAVTVKHQFDIGGTTFCEVWSQPLRLADTLDHLDRFLLDPEAGVALDSTRPAVRHALEERALLERSEAAHLAVGEVPALGVPSVPRAPVRRHLV